MSYSVEFYIDLLHKIYPCKESFVVDVKHKRNKRIMGTYTPSLHRIRIYDRYSDKDNINTAIHEYAHHIHYTEKEKEAKNNRPHRPEFKLIYHAFVVKAIQKRLVSNLLIDDLVAK